MDEYNIYRIPSMPIEIKNEILSMDKNPLSDFKKILNQSIDNLNTDLLKADQMAQEMMLGRVDIHQAMIAIEQANLSLRLLIQIRNKIIAAYEEIMRIQF